MFEKEANPSIRRSAAVAAVLALLASATIFLGGRRDLAWLEPLVLPLVMLAFPGIVAGFTATNAWHGGSALAIFAWALPVNFLLYWPAVHGARLVAAALRRRITGRR